MSAIRLLPTDQCPCASGKTIEICCGADGADFGMKNADPVSAPPGATAAEKKRVEDYNRRLDEMNEVMQDGLNKLHGTDTTPPDPKAAFPILAKGAKMGCIEGMFACGVLLAKGQGVERNPIKASEYYLMAAKNGDVAAQCNLGVMLRGNHGVAQNLPEAEKWLRKAVAQDDLFAMENLSNILMKKHTGEANIEAVALLRKLVEKGSTQGMVNLAVMLSHGWGAPTDFAAAVALNKRAAALGSLPGKAAMAELVAKLSRGSGNEMIKAKADKAARVAMEELQYSVETSSGDASKTAARIEELNLARTCDTCGKTEAQSNTEGSKLRYCSGCLLAKYCSVACQRLARPSHKAKCAVETAKRAEERKSKTKAPATFEVELRAGTGHDGTGPGSYTDMRCLKSITVKDGGSVAAADADEADKPESETR